MWEGSLGEELSPEIEIEVEKIKLYVTIRGRQF